MSNPTEFAAALVSGKWELSLPHFRADRGWDEDRDCPRWESWERARLDHMALNVGPKDVVYDIGAEEGDFPSLWHLWGAEVVMVEPTQKSWQIIRATWEANFGEDDPPLGCFWGFAGPESDFEGNPPLVWPMDVGDVRLRGDHGFCTLWERPDIPRTTIDQLTATAMKPPTVITMDIEGAEHQAMIGADFTLREFRPLCYVSVHPPFMEQYGDNAEDFHTYMADHDYASKLITTDHEEHWVYWPEERPEPHHA